MPIYMRNGWRRPRSDVYAKLSLQGILRKYGADAHVYLPGIGTVNGLTAGNYLDSAGTTDATVDNPVGLSLDAIGLPIPISTTTFTAYQATATSTTLPSTATCTTSGAYGFQIPAVYTAGRVYEYTISWSGNTARRDLTVDGYAGVAVFSNAEYGTATFKLKQPGVDLGVYAMSATAGDSFTLISLSVREIPGIHATQATTANKPILRRGLLNQLLWSNDASNGVWIKLLGATITPAYGTGPTGMPSTLLNLSATAGNRLEQVLTSPAVNGGSATGAVWLRGFGSIHLATNTDTGVGGNTEILVNLTPVWTLYSASATFTSPTGNPRLMVIWRSGDTATSCEIGVAGLFQGTYTAQQILDAGGIPLTTTAAASNPSAGKYSWQFDGSNDSLSLSAPLFQMSDDHCVIAGANCTSSANTPIFFAPSANTGDWKGSAFLYVDSSGKPRAYWNDGTNVPDIAGPFSVIGTTFVASARSVGNTRQLKVNGVLAGTVTTTMLATTVNAASIGVDPRTGTTEQFTGHLYPIIGIKGTVTDSDLLTLERFVGLLSGVSI